MSSDVFIDDANSTIYMNPRKTRYKKPCKYPWRCGDGRVLLLTQLTTDHLMNLAVWLKRKLDSYSGIRCNNPDIPQYKVNNRLGSDWMVDIVNELKERP